MNFGKYFCSVLVGLCKPDLGAPSGLFLEIIVFRLLRIRMRRCQRGPAPLPSRARGGTARNGRENRAVVARSSRPVHVHAQDRRVAQGLPRYNRPACSTTPVTSPKGTSRHPKSCSRRPSSPTPAPRSCERDEPVAPPAAATTPGVPRVSCLRAGRGHHCGAQPSPPTAGRRAPGRRCPAFPEGSSSATAGRGGTDRQSGQAVTAGFGEQDSGFVLRESDAIREVEPVEYDWDRTVRVTAQQPAAAAVLGQGAHVVVQTVAGVDRVGPAPPAFSSPGASSDR